MFYHTLALYINISLIENFNLNSREMTTESPLALHLITNDKAIKNVLKQSII